MNHPAGFLFFRKPSAVFLRRIHWINLPGAILLVLLQRLPALSAVFLGEEMVIAAPAGAVLRCVVATAAALGAVNSMAGATPLSPSSGTTAGVSVATGSSVSIFYTVNGTATPPQSWSISGAIPPGLNFSGLTGSGFVDTQFLNLSGSPTAPGSYHVDLVAYEFQEGGGSNSPVYHYTVTVTGAPTSTVPSITQQPQAQTVTLGDPVTFTGAANGSPAPTFQWRKDGNDIGGATGTAYSIANVSAGDAGSYTLVATNSAGSATSNDATLTVTIPATAPSITQHPQDQSVNVGGSVTFSAAADGNPSPTFQWRKDGNDIGGATGTSYTIPSVSQGDAGSYAVVATNLAGSATSNGATLTVTIPAVAPGITQQPQSQTVAVGNPVTFTGAADGTPAPSLQWLKNGANIGGATGTSYSLPSVSLGDAGFYALVATNSAGSATSNAATLTVTSPASIAQHPQNQTVTAGGAANFTVAAGGAPAPTYQWQRLPAGSGTWANVANGGAYSGVTTITLAVSGTTLAMGGDQFRCVATNSTGTATSNAATLAVLVPLPVITGQPVGQVAVTGMAIHFSVTATSLVSAGYQWQKGGTDIPGATSATYDIASFVTGDAGSYRVIVTNSAGAVTSNAATLAVATVPVITGQPATLTVYAGESAGFSVTATSNAAQGYVWRKNGSPISGATAATYTIVNAQAADVAGYSAVVSDIAGSVTSNDATLTVIAPILSVFTRQPEPQAITPGAPASFNVAATGGPAPTFQWQRLPAGSGTWANVSGGNYSGAATNSLTVTGSLLANNGDQFRCVAANLAGAVNSNPALLTVATSLAPVQVAGGNTHLQFVRAGGTRWASGGNNFGQLGDGTTTARLSAVQVSTNVVSVAAGSEHALFVKQDGTLWAHGYNGLGGLGTGNLTNASTPVQVGSGVAAAVAGYRHSLFRKTDGTLWAMGWNAFGQLGDGTTTDRSAPVLITTHVVNFSAGFAHNLVIKSDGTAWAFGWNAYGQLGDGTTTDRSTPLQVASGVSASAGGFFHTLLLKTDGTLWAGGRNDAGQLGNGTTTNQSTPVQVATNVSAIAAGALHSLFLKTDGTLWAMGTNDRGELGDGTLINRPSPVQIASNVASVGAGVLETFFIKTDGTLWAAGANDQGQLGDGTTTDRATPVQIAGGALVAPGSVAGSSATNSAAADRVQLTWTPVIGATHYEVWRSVTNDSSTAARLAARIAGAFYEDLSGTAGTDYYYWIKAVSPGGTGNFGSPALGRQGASSATLGISAHPAGQTINVGDSVTFSVTATGTAPFTYQWRKDAVNLGSATAASYTINPAAVADAGNYDVVVTNAAGNLTSNAASLTVNKLAQTITFNALADRAYTATPFALTANATSGLGVIFVILSGPATVSGNDVTLTGAGTVTVRSSQPGDATYAAAAEVDRSFTAGANFGSWAQSKFTAGELLDANLSGPNAVFGHDGLPNLLKYALGLEPKQDITTDLPTVSVVGLDWVYTYTRPANVTDVTYEVEVSPDLVNWTTAGVTHELVSSGGGIETWRGRYPLGSAANAMFRLRITRP